MRKRPKDYNNAPDISEETTERATLVLNRITPMTKNQALAFDAFLADQQHLLLHGLPGTGKTFIALYLSLQALNKKQYHKVTIVRSVVPTRTMGFLPGTDKRKSAVYEAPYADAASKLFGRNDAYNTLKRKRVLDFVTTSFIRGTNIDNSIVIVDEVQNMSEMELHSIITRIGENCRLIMCGDIGQDDLTSSRYNEYSGLSKMLRILDRMSSIQRIEFGPDDIVRSQFVREYILAKQEVEKQVA